MSNIFIKTGDWRDDGENGETLQKHTQDSKKTSKLKYKYSLNKFMIIMVSTCTGQP